MYLAHIFIILIGILACSVSAINVINAKDQNAVPKIPLRTFSRASLTLTLYDDGSYQLLINGAPWLFSAPSFLYVNGQRYSMADKTLVLKNTVLDSGEDRLGKWESLGFLFVAGEVKMVTSFRAYSPSSGVSGVVFEQSFPDGAKNTSVGNKDLLISGFPGFYIDDSVTDLGYLSYGYIMVGDMGKKIGRWSASNFTIRDGRNGGPMALFDKSGKNAVFVSPFDQFMSTSVLHQQKEGCYYWGIMGSVKNIPKGFSFRSIVYYGTGINDAMSGWGKVMRTYYNKLPHYRESDFTNNYLSYWSDNGAYYVNYYVKGGLIQNMTYEEAMLKVKTYSDSLSVPYRSLQYSVWFTQGEFGGNGYWNGSTLLFPDGMKYMFSKTGLPATSHSRFWSPDTPYAKQNGGKYQFFVEKTLSLPYEEKFWTDLFAVSQQFGFMTYMQDWLNKQFDDMDATTDNVHVARTWLMQMGEGARKNGITIQYCMSESRHILQSLEIPVVTQARASDDYQPNDPAQWRIGTSSLFAHAVGLAPYKDTFWTTTDQPGNYYHGTEPYPALQTVISTLSTAAVGPGDMVNGTDAKLLMKCCAVDGLILKPSRPALVVDAQLIQAAFGGEIGPVGEVWTTYSDIGVWRFGIIFATDIQNWYNIGPSAAHFGSNFPVSKVYSLEPESFPAMFDEKHPVTVSSDCTKTSFCLYYTTPVFTFWGKELLLLGELSKYVPISPQRVLGIEWDENDFNIKLKGAAKESVEFSYVQGKTMKSVVCVMSAAGTSVISIADSLCYGY